jgi:hypothetical protein
VSGLNAMGANFVDLPDGEIQIREADKDKMSVFVGGFPNQYFADVHCRVGFSNA